VVTSNMVSTLAVTRTGVRALAVDHLDGITVGALNAALVHGALPVGLTSVACGHHVRAEGSEDVKVLLCYPA